MRRKQKDCKKKNKEAPLWSEKKLKKRSRLERGTWCFTPKTEEVEEDREPFEG